MLFTSQPIASVTVEEVTNGAQVARGTFYCALRPRRTPAPRSRRTWRRRSIISPTRSDLAADPVARIAAGCAAFIDEAQRDPAWGVLIARRRVRFSCGRERGAGAPESNLLLAKGEGRLASISSEVGFDLVFGVVVRPCARQARRDYRPLTCRTWSAEFCARSELGRRKPIALSRSQAKQRTPLEARLRRPREISSDGGNLGYQPRSV